MKAFMNYIAMGREMKRKWLAIPANQSKYSRVTKVYWLLRLDQPMLTAYRGVLVTTQLSKIRDISLIVTSVKDKARRSLLFLRDQFQDTESRPSSYCRGHRSL
jgi:hypothetical protein